MAAGAALLVTLWSLSSASAADPVHLTVIRERAVTSCPSDESLRRRVEARVGGQSFVETGTSREVRVVLLRRGDGLEAHVSSTTMDGRSAGERVLRGPLDCRKLGDDLVFALALVVDPLSVTRRPRSTAKAPGPGSGGGDRELDPPFGAAREGAGDSPAPRDDDAPVAARADDLAAKPSDTLVRSLGESFELPVDLGAHLALLATAGTSPVVAPTIAARLSIGIDGLEPIGPLDAQLGARLDLPARTPLGGPALLDTTLLAGSIGLCRPFALSAELAIPACGVVDVGGLSVQGVNLVGGHGVTTPWVAVGVRSGAVLRLWRAAAVELIVDVTVPTIRPRFVDNDASETFFQPWPIVASVGLGVVLDTRGRGDALR